MNTTDKRNGTFPRDPGNPNTSDRNTVMNEELYDLNTQETQNSRAEDAERGYTVRNGYNPNRPNPDQEDFASDDDLDDLDDDFHKDRDLEDNDDTIYEVVLEDEDDLEDEDEDEDEYVEEDLDEEIENDEFDNPADTFENDFNETEEDLEEIDDEEDNDYVEDDVQEDNDDEEYPENDPRRL